MRLSYPKEDMSLVITRVPERLHENEGMVNERDRLAG